MPELPEVETVRRHLTEGIEGATVTSVEVGHPRTARRQPNPADLVDRLVGRRVERVGRKGKFLMIEVGDFTWVIHLGMSGRVSLDPPDAERAPHTHLVVGFDTGIELRLGGSPHLRFQRRLHRRGDRRLAVAAARGRRLGAAAHRGRAERPVGRAAPLR